MGASGPVAGSMSYDFLSYVSTQRMITFWYHLSEIMRLGVGSVLEVGVGPGMVTALLKTAGLEVKTADIDPALRPDYVAAVQELSSQVPPGSCDLVLCARVLHYVGLDQLDQAISELAKVTRRYAIITVPVNDLSLSLGWYVTTRPFHWAAIRLPLALKTVLRRLFATDAEGVYPSAWKLDCCRDASLSVFEARLRRFFTIQKSYAIPEVRTHRLFLLEKIAAAERARGADVHEDSNDPGTSARGEQGTGIQRGTRLSEVRGQGTNRPATRPPTGGSQLKVPWDRGGLRSYLTILALALARPDSSAFWWALPVLLAGVALHIYAKGCLRQNQVVSMGGPYRFVRHPFYTANLLIDASIALMSGYWPLIAVLPAWWLLVYMPVIREEEAYLTRLFPDVYPAYQRSVPLLLPFRRPRPPRGEPFSWSNRNIVADTVLPRALRLLALPVLFFVWRETRGHGSEVFTQGPGAAVLWGITVLAMLHGVSLALRRHLRDGKRIVPKRLSVRWTRVFLALLLVVLAGTVHQMETEASLLLPLVAGVALAATLPLFRRGSLARLMAEAAALMAVISLCELPWLMPIAMLLYAPLLLDQRLVGAPDTEQPWQLRAAPRALRLAAVSPYSCIVVLGIAMAVVKELM